MYKMSDQISEDTLQALDDVMDEQFEHYIDCVDQAFNAQKATAKAYKTNHRSGDRVQSVWTVEGDCLKDVELGSVDTAGNGFLEHSFHQTKEKMLKKMQTSAKQSIAKSLVKNMRKCNG